VYATIPGDSPRLATIFCGGKGAGSDRTPRWRDGEAEWPEKGGWGVALF